MDKISLLAPCKINLSLAITGRLPDGYHHMEMVMQTVSLWDQVDIFLNGGREVRIFTDAAQIPADRTNIAWRAAMAYFQGTELDPVGLDITLHKGIPAQAGLGGGSADGAAVLVGLNQLLGGGVSSHRLAELGFSVGADIPFCLLGGTRLVTGKGERTCPVSPMPDCFIVLAKPAEGVSTAGAFARFDQIHPDCPGETKQVLKALETEDMTALGQALFNVLEPVCGLEEVPFLVDKMKTMGAVGACMSGSGSAVFGLFSQEKEASRCREALEALGFWSALCQPVSHGPVVKE